MAYVPFHDYFPKLAERETRAIHLFEGGPFPAIPRGEYGLLEAFCDDPDCDCRRVMWSVASSREQGIVAVIAYGWESRQFYQEWYGSNNASVIAEMCGPVLNLASLQAAFAPAILDMITQIVLPDKKYLERVKRHYALFRGKIGKPPQLMA